VRRHAHGRPAAPSRPGRRGCLGAGPIALGHRRLSIIDLSEANNQPLADHTGHFWVVFNGEIYNFQALRKELERDGRRFRTAGDTEVILEAYKRWGVECLRRFNGMFAFALWDEPAGGCSWPATASARSRCTTRRCPTAASRSRRSCGRCGPTRPSRPRSARPRSGHYLSLNYTLTAACMIEGVQKLPAAHYLVVERGGVRTRSSTGTWRPTSGTSGGTARRPRRPRRWTR
jgi:asparagine synthase (glutamine-hydrolysing)